MRTALIASLAATALAAPQVQEQLVMGNPSSAAEAVAAFDLFDKTGFEGWDLNERRLVQFEGHEPVWMTEAEKIHAKMAGMRFFDITDVGRLEDSAHLVSFMKKRKRSSFAEFGVLKLLTAYPKLSKEKFVRSTFKNLTIEGPVENLQKFTSFRTRHYRSSTGRESQLWLLNKIQETTLNFASEKQQKAISISEFEHSWGQHSIIVRINGTESDEVVVVSAHQDSTNLLPFLPAPGADDDGSGTVTILETYRGLLAADFKPAKTVEFHWYSAEEAGLLGSQAVAQEYQKSGVPVYAQIQFDMTAWVKKGTREEVGIMNDFVNPDLTEFLRGLVGNYIDIPWVDTKCGYGCSDHASWTKAGYPGSCAFESAFENDNSNVHSGNDRIDVSPEFSFEHLLHFTKIAAAFVIELAS
ncbi:peptidase [Auriculariales sp. MPI-PUGE-AT-0066]|nr:peptidase [Auriculariales sp. MPI-PUGE-AT-0066]